MPDHTTGLPKLNTPLSLSERLYASENHRGFDVLDELGRRIGYVYPLDENGAWGRELADEIVRRCNAFDGVVGALKAMLEDAHFMITLMQNECGIRDDDYDAVEKANAALAAAEEGRE